MDTSSLTIGALELSEPYPDTQDSEVEYFTATFMAYGLQATSRVYAFMSQGLAELIALMAIEWKGWSGERDWESLEHDLRLSFSHDGLGHIRVAVELRDAAVPEWIVKAWTSIDAGDLDTLAKRAKRFLRA